MTIVNNNIDSSVWEQIPSSGGASSFFASYSPVNGNVFNFGAVGDGDGNGGGTDDTAAIQACHDFLEATGGGTLSGIMGKIHRCDGALIINPRMVSIDTFQCLIDNTNIRLDAGIGTSLINGDNSTFAASAGQWVPVGLNMTIASQLCTVTGAVVTGDTVIVTATSAGIVGSPIAVPYVVKQSDTTLANIASGVASTVNSTAAMQVAGIRAFATGAVISFYTTTPIAPAVVWTKTNGANALLTLSLGASPSGVCLQNISGAQACATLALPTIPNKWYVVKYNQQTGGAQLIQTNVYAHATPNTTAFEYCVNTSNCFFKFQAKNFTTYITLRPSSESDGTYHVGDFTCLGSITCKQCTPPGIYSFDRTGNVATILKYTGTNPVGTQYTIAGGVFTTPGKLTIVGVDNNNNPAYAVMTSEGSGYTTFPTNPVTAVAPGGQIIIANVAFQNWQFGHETHPFRNINMKGPGKIAYDPAVQQPYAIYTDPFYSDGIYCNTPNISGDRNGSSTRGAIQGFNARNYDSAITLNDQTYLFRLERIGINNCNFGILVTNGQNAGENNQVIGGFITGCIWDVCLDAHAITLRELSLDYPKNGNILINGANAGVVFIDNHFEQSPPGESTQLQTPIQLVGLNSYLIYKGSTMLLSADGSAGNFNSMISTTSATQQVVLEDIAPNNIKTKYLVSGSANRVLQGYTRMLQGGSLPMFLGDGGAGNEPLDSYGYGDFEVPAVATSTVPGAPIAIGANFDEPTIHQIYAKRYQSNLMILTLSTAQFASGSQSLQIDKLGGNAVPGFVYMWAPVRVGALVWWTFKIKVLAPTGVPLLANSIITMKQSAVSFLGYESIGVGANSGTTQQSVQPTGYPAIFTSKYSGLGQSFIGNSPGGIQVSNINGTNGVFQLNNFDVVNHINNRQPAGATHSLFTLDFTNFDGAAWGTGKVFLDEVQCWPA